MAGSRGLKVVDSEDGFNLPPLDREEGTSFGYFERLFFGYNDGKVFDYGDWEARDLTEMFGRDYKARQIEAVLTLPIISATHTLSAAKDDSGEYEWLQSYWDADHLNGGCKTPLDLVIDQATSAITYKRSYHEKVWTVGKGEFEGKTVYDKIGWRPQTTCRLMRDAVNGDFRGFQQQSYYVGPEISNAKWPIEIGAKRAYVYIHGTRRDPMGGVSDMEVAYWAWKTKQKILFLWWQFLEGVSLPRTIVKAADVETARKVARQLAKVKSSGILPVGTNGDPNAVGFDVLNLEGKGADQFTAAIKWLDSCATNSVLAGFLDLTDHAANGRGSLALSKDQSDFFLQSLEAKTTELARSVRKDLLAPLVRYNFGPSSKVPNFAFEPLNAEDKSYAVTMLTDLMRSRDPALVPDEFIGQLAQQVADYLGMDGDKIRTAFDKAAADARAAAAKQSAQLATAQGQAVAGAAGAVGAANSIVGRAKLSSGAPSSASLALPKTGRGTTIPGIGGAPQLPSAY